MESNPPASRLADTRARLRAAWRFVLFVLLYLVLFYTGTLAAAFLARRLSLGMVLRAILVTDAAGLSAVMLATGLLLAGVDNRGFSYVGLGLQPGWKRELGWGFGLGLLMIGGIVALEWATGHLRLAGPEIPAGRVALRLLAVFGLFFAGAVHEEMAFRGYAFQRLLEVLGKPASVLLLAALFGAVHYGNPNATVTGTVNTALVGVLFAIAYLRTGRLWLPIGLHWSWNFLEAAFGLPVSGITIEEMPLTTEVAGRELFHGGAYGPEASLFATAAIALVTLLLLRIKPVDESALPKEVS